MFEDFWVFNAFWRCLKDFWCWESFVEILIGFEKSLIVFNYEKSLITFNYSRTKFEAIIVNVSVFLMDFFCFTVLTFWVTFISWIYFLRDLSAAELQ